MTNFQRLLRALGRNIYKARSNKRLTQQDFAKLCNLPRSTLSLLECGRSNPSLQTLTQVSEALNISINDLISTRKNFAWEILESDIKREEFDNGKVRVLRLLPAEVTTINLQEIEIDECGKFTNSPKPQFSKEFLTVLTGDILLRLENSSTFINAGNSVHFRCDQTYSYENIGEDTARAIATVVPFSIFANWQ